MTKKVSLVFLLEISQILILFLCLPQLNAQPYNFYYGNIHAHSGYSDGNVDSATSLIRTPAQDYAYAQASAYFDFLGISDHNHSSAGMSLAEFHLGVAQAQTAGQPGVFTALYGMEYGVINNGGHLLVYGIDSLIGWQSGNYDIFCGQYDYAQLFGIVNAHAGAFCSLAHPQSTDYTNLTSSSYSTAADNAISGCCIRNGAAFSTTTNYSDPPATSYENYYKTLLGRGYHAGPSLDHDNHYTTFGRTTQGRTVVLANSLTKTDILEALRNMRYYASDDWNVEVNYTLNGLYMGSVADITADPTLSVSVTDPDGENVAQIAVYYGVPGSNSQPTVLTTANNTATLTYTHPIGVGSTYYYYLKIQQPDGNLIWTAPVWVHKVAAAALPLELLSFEATPQKAAVRLDWTANVRTPQVFQVERSTDGAYFERLGETNATPAPDAMPFVFDDLQPVNGLAFYRLRVVDADGTISYSPIISAAWRFAELEWVSVGPNPVQQSCTVRLNAVREDTYWWFLYNADGREQARQPFDAVSGENSLRIETSALAPGVYYLIIGQPGRRILLTKLIKS